MTKRAKWILIGVLLFGGRAAAKPPTLVAPRAILVDPKDDDKVLMSKDQDSVALQGRIAILMTAYVTSWAVKHKYVTWGDVIPFSKRDVEQGCACMKYEAKPAATKGAGCTTSSLTQPGQQFTLEDQLRVSLNQSTGESTNAIAEHVASMVYRLQAATTTTAESEKLMDLFVGLMNKRAAELHLDHSRWITVHGGDTCDFAAGCDPTCTQDCLCESAPECAATCTQDCHPQNCPQGSQCKGGTTVHDLALLWHALTRTEPKFLGLIGARAFALSSGPTYFNSYGHDYGYYPGLDGDAAGNSSACPNDDGAGGTPSCQMAQATRAGHPLIAAALQSFTTLPNKMRKGAGEADLTAMFRWGFGKVLEPVRKVDSGKQLTEVVKDHAIACNLGQCFTAIRRSDDTLGVVVWNAQPQKNLLQKLVTSNGPPKGYGAISALDIDANQTAGTVAAFVSGGKVKVARWWLTQLVPNPPLQSDVTLKFLGDSGTKGGAGTAVRVRLAGDKLAVTAVRAADGSVHLSTWKLAVSPSPKTAVTWIADATAAQLSKIGPDDEIALSVLRDPGPSQGFIAVTGFGLSSGPLMLQSWRISASGAITSLNAVGSPAHHGRNLALAAQGAGKLGVTFTEGIDGTGGAEVEVWDVAHDGAFFQTLKWADVAGVATATGIAPLGPPASAAGIVAVKTEPATTDVFASGCGSNSTPATKESQRAPAAFLTAAVRAGEGQLASWDSPTHYTEATGTLGDFRLADSGSAWGKVASFRLAALMSDDPLLNQYVTEQQKADGTLLLIGWQVGTPTPFPPPTLSGAR